MLNYAKLRLKVYEDMMTLTCCQDHILTEYIWFVWSKTSYIGDERRCYRCGTNDDRQTNQQTMKKELLSQWKLEAEFRNKPSDVAPWISQ